jgi:hypothetical protein
MPEPPLPDIVPPVDIPDAPPVIAPPVIAPPVIAPPVIAPPVVAPPVIAPPVEAPPVVEPPVDDPPVALPAMPPVELPPVSAPAPARLPPSRSPTPGALLVATAHAHAAHPANATLKAPHLGSASVRNGTNLAWIFIEPREAASSAGWQWARLEGTRRFRFPRASILIWKTKMAR